MKHFLLLPFLFVSTLSIQAYAEGTFFGTLAEREEQTRSTYRSLEQSLTESTGLVRQEQSRVMRILEQESEKVSIQRFDSWSIDMLNTLIREGKIHLYAQAKEYTPVLYTDDFSWVFGGGSSSGLLLDDWEQVDPLEFVAFPKTGFEIRGVSLDRPHPILRVISEEYSYVPDSGHYIDARFVDIFWKPVRPIEKRVALLPKPEEIIRKLRSQVGKQYVWGGNTQIGIKKLLTYYRPNITLDTKMRSKWILDGFDCSGLLFWATHGVTPRNTSNLVSYGTGLTLSGKTLEEVRSMLRPLDIIVWVGHNLIVLDNDEVIESTVNFTGSGNFSTPNWVRIRKIDDVLQDVMVTRGRIGVDKWTDPVPTGKKKFVIRRWIPETVR